MNVTAAYAVEDPSQISGTRRAALDLAAQIGFSEERAGQVALIVSELATNLAKHAKGGRAARPTDSHAMAGPLC